MSAMTGNAVFLVVGAGFGYWVYGAENRQKELVEIMHRQVIAARNLRAEAARQQGREREEILLDLERKTAEAAK
jgi:hypothetical protein